MTFLSTSPARGTTRAERERKKAEKISIHVPREGDDRLGISDASEVTISIHVPREGDDCAPPAMASATICISIHVPREGDDRRPVPRAVKA